jgi:hypothetical protein
VILYASLISCKSKKKTGTANDLIGEYRIEQYEPLDTSTQARARAEQAVDWKIMLEEKNNFQITGTGINTGGYWTVKQGDDKEYYLLLQGGGYKIDVKFDATHILFDRPTKMLDTVFSRVLFTRVDDKKK